MEYPGRSPVGVQTSLQASTSKITFLLSVAFQSKVGTALTLLENIFMNFNEYIESKRLASVKKKIPQRFGNGGVRASSVALQTLGRSGAFSISVITERDCCT
jgi:hypothetical protein